MKNKKNIVAGLCLFTTFITASAQKTPVKKTVAPVKQAPVKTSPAPAATAGNNSLTYTIEEQNGTKRDMSITSAPRPANEQSSYFNTARVDLAHTDGSGNKQPVLKLDINNEKNQNLSAAMLIPFVNDTGTVVVTYQSDYDNLNGWNIHFEGYRLSPQTITIHITRWAAVGDFIEGTFSGMASLVKENYMYDNDNPAPLVTISNGKFRIRRVKDQTGYGGE